MFREKELLIRAIIKLSYVIGFIFLIGCSTTQFGLGGGKTPKPDLRIKSIKVVVIKDGGKEREVDLKMGDKNIIKVVVENASTRVDAGQSVTKLEVHRGRSPQGDLIREYALSTPAIQKRGKEKVFFRRVAIPQTEEPAWYTLVATADSGGAVDEFKEDNNTSHVSRFVNQ